MNAVSVRVALMALRAYKLCISPYFRGSCRFLPSCADYAAEAIERHGVLRGSWLAAGRLARADGPATGSRPGPAIRVPAVAAPDLDQARPIEFLKKKKQDVVAELLEDALLGHPG